MGFVIIGMIIYNNNNMKDHKITAVAVFSGRISGTVYFEETNTSNILIKVNLKGLKKSGMHGFHIHEAGDLTEGCTSMCAHFNPYNKTHGCPGMKHRHVGDLGNLITDSKGEAFYCMEDNMIQLKGKNSILGRGLIIHQDEDDCGLGNNAESLKTGNAGKRIACAVIGYAQSCIK